MVHCCGVVGPSGIAFLNKKLA